MPIALNRLSDLDYIYDGELIEYDSGLNLIAYNNAGVGSSRRPVALRADSLTPSDGDWYENDPFDVANTSFTVYTDTLRNGLKIAVAANNTTTVYFSEFDLTSQAWTIKDEVIASTDDSWWDSEGIATRAIRVAYLNGNYWFAVGHRNVSGNDAIRILERTAANTITDHGEITQTQSVFGFVNDGLKITFFWQSAGFMRQRRVDTDGSFSAEDQLIAEGSGTSGSLPLRCSIQNSKIYCISPGSSLLSWTPGDTATATNEGNITPSFLPYFRSQIIPVKSTDLVILYMNLGSPDDVYIREFTGGSLDGSGTLLDNFDSLGYFSAHLNSTGEDLRVVAAANTSLGPFLNQYTVFYDRNLATKSEYLVLAASKATVIKSVPRVVSCSAEEVNLVGSPATVVTDRSVSCAAEVLSFSEASADISKSRLVFGAAELLLLTESAAQVDQGRDIVGVVESLVVAEGSAAVGKSRDVGADTENLVISGLAAAVNQSRHVQCTVESLSLSENSAAVNQNRAVAGTGEALIVTENTATISKGRTVSCVAESVSITTPQASVNRSRDVVGTTESLQLSEANALVDQGRLVSAGTESLTLALNSATVSTSSNRIVSGQTESLSLVTGSALVVKDRYVVGTTEIITLIAANSNVNIDVNHDVLSGVIVARKEIELVTAQPQVELIVANKVA